MQRTSAKLETTSSWTSIYSIADKLLDDSSAKRSEKEEGEKKQ
jgi:hypothetical protein